VPDRPRLLLLDGHSLAYRAFYALPVENFSTSTGQPTNAVYGFTSMLINALRDEAPTHLAVAFDVSRATFRSEAFPEYKANRSTSPDAFKGQVSLIQDVLHALNVPSLQVEGYEADDIIATLTEQAAGRGIDVAIITGDRDAFQLVANDVTVLYPKRGVSDLDRMTPAAVEERYGLTPAQYPDYAALRGDPSDNLPGIPGVGEKTAAKWVREFGSLAELLARADEVKGKAGEALRDHLDQVERNRQLTELVRTVPLPVDVDGLRRQSWDRDAVHEVFDALQFRVLRDRLYQTLETPEPEAQSGFELDVERLTAQTLAGWLAEHAAGPDPVGFAASGTWTRGGGAVTGLAWASADGGQAWVDPAALDSTAEPVLASWLADPARTKVMHHAKGPMLALRAQGWTLAGVSFDTELATYLIRPDQRSYDLADLVLRNLHRELRSESADDGQLTLGGEPEETAAVDLGLQARAVLDLAEVVGGELTRSGGAALLRDVEIPLEHVLVDMEVAGVGVDVEYLDELRSHFADEVKAAAQAAYAEIGREVNLGSPKQLQVVLFDELGLPKTKRIKTGYTTDAEALQGLYAQTEHPFLQHLLRHRDAAKLLVTVEGLQRCVNDDQRIHTTYNQTVAATGRLSSADPNLQNIPIRTDEGRRIRRAFAVGPGYESLLTADYSQVEMRIMAHLSEDTALREAFESGEDLHTTVASRVFGVPSGEVTTAMRARIKAMSYGLAYGLSAYGLSQQLGIAPEEARGLMDEYFQRFGGVRDYLNEVVAQARQTGYTETIMGRRRYLPDLTSDNRQRREMAERMALNAPIQGSAADITKVAMLNVARALSAEGLQSRLLLQVHDELVLEVAVGERDALEALVRAQMAAAYDLRPSLDVSVGVGRTWDDAAH
jgi:DNA polymerase I